MTYELLRSVERSDGVRPVFAPAGAREDYESWTRKAGHTRRRLRRAERVLVWRIPLSIATNDRT